MVSPRHNATLRLGDWRETLTDVTMVDALITDPPYSKRVHDGHNKGRQRDKAKREKIDYDHLTRADVAEFVESWHARTRGWIVICTSHDLVPWWEESLTAVDRVVFPPIPFVAIGMTVRRQGDGPSSWSLPIVVSRPRGEPWSKWGTLDGAYILPKGYVEPGFDEQRILTGQKPAWLMRRLVRDYSRRGDLICDPFAGAATTLIAAAVEHRHAIGSELKPDTYGKALAQIDRGHTPTLRL